ncbi:MAG: hypothetical protein KGH64_00785 [Candidatus Micrarchaeota archaeon]|nr:hypothetical protein [Candidatus Micrarchaeota archaeon]
MAKFRYGLILPQELHTKLRIAIAERKVSAEYMQGMTRWVLKSLLEYHGVRFTQNYGSDLHRAWQPEDKDISLALIEVLLRKVNSAQRLGAEGASSGANPSGTSNQEVIANG